MATRRKARSTQREPSAGETPAARNGAPAVPLLTVVREDGTAAGPAPPALPAPRLLFLYESMVRVREFDRRMLMLQRQGRIGFYGPILGQEAATVGSAAAFEERDWIFPALREGAAALMRGLPLEVAIAQLIGNSLDRCKGRQMPCHYTFREGNYYGMSSVIGTQISHAVGAAMAAKIRGDDVVVAGYLGDGATSANDFHAGMNFAAVYRAPVVLICQNNGWAISVPISQQSNSETIAIKAEAYGMPSMRVDGNDVLAVHQATREAVARARAGDGPTFLELVTYRRLGHSSSDDPTRYRDEAEVKAWEKRDPVERFRRYLEAAGLWDADREQALVEDIAREVNQAIKAAEAAPPVEPETLITDVFREVPSRLRMQLGVALEARERALEARERALEARDPS
jgi:pyruvate dehydrogenase E1 component alpha subunit/2-oxoisovalerate dehydrogenase E1 component alpha subunit